MSQSAGTTTTGANTERVAADEGGGAGHRADHDPPSDRGPVRRHVHREQEADDERDIERLAHHRRVDGQEGGVHGGESGGDESDSCTGQAAAEQRDEDDRHDAEHAARVLEGSLRVVGELDHAREEQGVQRRPKGGRRRQALSVELRRIDVAVPARDRAADELVPQRVETEPDVRRERLHIGDAQRQPDRGDEGERARKRAKPVQPSPRTTSPTLRLARSRVTDATDCAFSAP